MTVVGVGSCLKVTAIWNFMFTLTLVQSRTHVDTVQNVLDNSAILRHICWSHTMKVLGSYVTFVRRNSPRNVTLRNIYVVMKVWSRMFAETVQSVSVQQVNWDLMHWNTQTSNTFAAVHVVNISDVNKLSNVTSVSVLLNWDMSMSFSGSKCCRVSGQ